MIFDQELKKHGAFGCQNMNCKGSLDEEWAEKGALRALHSVPLNFAVHQAAEKAFNNGLWHLV